MSVRYTAIGWNRQKRMYDGVLILGICLYAAVFAGAGAAWFPSATAETLLIRAFGTLAFILLHVILSIGPLCRLDPRFLPFLYNRRHLGVAMFLVALAHGLFSTVQFHSFGDADPLRSILVSNTRWGSVSQFPFQQLGLAALLILFLMAATSHDFWLQVLTPPVWKRLHMLVYLVYALLVAHVGLGALQSVTSNWWALLLVGGVVWLSTIHIWAAFRERKAEQERGQAESDGFIPVCQSDAIPNHRATVVTAGAERIAVFRNGDRISALSNVCRHQNGPLGEGKIINGCVTCPWHGYQYLPETGTSPPPFDDQVPTYRTRVVNGMIWLHPAPLPPGTYVEPARVSEVEDEC